VAKAHPIDGLSEEDPYAAVAAKVLAVRAAELADHATGVLDTNDIERLHDMRVASRRLRAALEVFEPCFPRKQFKAALGEVKQLADTLGERRDRDVTIAALGEFAEAVGTADRAGVASLVADLRSEQAKRALAPHVSEERLAALAARLGELVRTAAELGGVPVPAQPPPAEAEPSSDRGSRADERAREAGGNGAGAQVETAETLR
jgi:CHAD domain-containing protein